MSILNPADDLSLCDKEPIHQPGSIQPHGMLLVAGRDGLVCQVAGEVENRLGVADCVGSPLTGMIGETLSALAAGMYQPGARGGFIGQLHTAAGETLDVSACLSDCYLLIELETAASDGSSNSAVLDRLAIVATAFEQAVSLIALCNLAAIEFRRITGFDRVMVYQFLEGNVGKVVSEDRRADQHAFLNHHFPASDIPRQAHALYLRNRIRVIPDITYRPVPLRPPSSDPTPLDLSDCSLRSVSPIHLQYLANMQVMASASISIVKDGLLWGLIACHNETPRALTYDVRAACRSLAGSMGRQITMKEEAEGYRQRIRLRSYRDDVITLLAQEGSLVDTLPAYLAELGRMMKADGVAVLRGADLVASGVCPPKRDMRALASWVLLQRERPVFSTDHLRALYPPAASFSQAGGGLLAVTLSPEDPWLLMWFRAEQIETVNWAGNPHKTGTGGDEEQLTPRASFAAWKENVEGRSRRWTIPELDAASRLRSALLDVQQTERVRELNRQLTAIVQDKDRLLLQKVFLIGEINHRVQNSLSLVSSFLALQARASKNADVQIALEEARRRLNAVALVHRRLYRGDQVDVVDAARYIEELCDDTLSFMGPEWAQHLSLNLAPVMVPVDLAVPLGLVFTELMINANKYAYDGAAGPIDVRLSGDTTEMQMCIADKGIGKLSSIKGFGSRIMEGLIEQLGGKLTQADNRPGLRITITVPIGAAPVV